MGLLALAGRLCGEAWCSPGNNGAVYGNMHRAADEKGPEEPLAGGCHAAGRTVLSQIKQPGGTGRVLS